jgi:hypothetical protein
MKYLAIILILVFPFLMTKAQNVDNKGMPSGKESSSNPESQIANKINNYHGESGIPCKPNTFWAISDSGNVLEFQLNGNTVVYKGIVVSSSNSPVKGSALAFGNNITGNLFNPTFYSSDIDFIGYYFNGFSWVAMNESSSCPLYNATAIDNNLYYQFNGYSPYCITKYNGLNYSQIYSSDSLAFSVADLAVDNIGNIWTFTTDSLSSLFTKYVMVLSSTGTVLKYYNFIFNTLNAYGCFLLNNILYIGLGSYNPIYPNTLLPLSFTSNSVFIGTPISMPATKFSDLASCEPGVPAAIFKADIKDLLFDITPDPVIDFLHFRYKSNDIKIEINILNLEGHIIKTISNKGKDLSIDLSNLSSGVYFFQLKTEKRIEIRKFVKQ